MAYRRAAELRQVVDALRLVAPSRVYLAFDGPRQGEEALCAAARAVADEIDWGANVQQLVQPHNLGCRAGVSEALSWFFSHVDEGIVLEDDTVPHPSFFQYCDELLERYRDDERVWMVSGTNLMGAWPAPTSYFFGDGGVWGWATWRRAWSHFDPLMPGWRHDALRRRAAEFLGSKEWRRLKPFYDDAAHGAIDTWDFQWSFIRASYHALSAIPSTNLVRNVGFGNLSTHTADAQSPLADIPAAGLAFPLVHPGELIVERRYQDAVRRLQQSPHGVRLARAAGRSLQRLVRARRH